MRSLTLDRDWHLSHEKCDRIVKVSKRASSESCKTKGWLPASWASERSKPYAVTFLETDIGACADFRGKMEPLLKELFRWHASGKILDAERFLHCQAVLALVSNSKFDRVKSMDDFLNLALYSSNASPFEKFCDWQVKAFKDRGFDNNQIMKLFEESLRRLAQTSPKGVVPSKRPSQQLPTDARWKGSGIIEQAGLQRLYGVERRHADYVQKMKDAFKTNLISKETESQRKRLAELSVSQSKDDMILQHGRKEQARLQHTRSYLRNNTDRHKSGVDDFWEESVREYSKCLDTKRDALQQREACAKEGKDNTEHMADSTDSSTGREKPRERFGAQRDLITDTRDRVNPSIQSLAAHLTVNAATKEKRAWAIFAWVCNNISYDVEGFQGRAPRKSCDAESVLKARVCVCEGYARLFESLCKEADLDVIYIAGKARTNEGSIGKSLSDKDGHAWNAVKLQGKWCLVDCTWGAGTCSPTQFTAKFRPHYFCIDPCALAFSHFPDDASWQLLPRSLSLENFVAQPHVWTADFFGYGLEFDSDVRPTGVVTLKGTNEGSITLKVPQNVDLLADLDGQEERCFQVRHGSAIAVHFRLHLKQQFLTIYGRRKKETGSYAAVCAFSIARKAAGTAYVEPWFPKVWWEPFSRHGIQFVDEFPHGLLRPDSTRTVILKLKVPAAKTVIASLRAEGMGKIDASCRELEAGVVKISCDQVCNGFVGELLVFANDRSESSFDAVLSCRVEG
mmetsp:Transcript_6970/g.11010  ORF Transcript_6970/g.11010 Transcript_6970/m.11010 type:complete len:737 (+) Transcript_6970:54-2264(+)